jgi:hypothetical protein
MAKGLLGHARALESRIARTVDRAAQRVARSGERKPLEIAHAVADVAVDAVVDGVVDSAVARVEPAGRGRHVFPFNVIKVVVLAPTREARARCAAVFDGEPTLRDRIEQRLASAGCDAIDVAVQVSYAARAKPGWAAADFHVAFDRLDPVPRPPAAGSRHVLSLTVVHGAATQERYAFTQARVDLGRCADVRDSRQRLVRTNHVAFLDEADAVNRSVSRQHAHIDMSAEGECRVYDDRSARGTGVLRRGATIPVPPGTRGVRLLAGDEIVLGSARLRVGLPAPRRRPPIS